MSKITGANWMTEGARLSKKQKKAMEQLSLPFKIKSADEIADQILERIKNEPEWIQKAIVCEMYYLNICEKLDQMPENIVNGLVVKLVERYFIKRGEDEKSLVKKSTGLLPG